MKYHIELPDKDYDLILTEYKEIPLTQGKVTLVDVEDYDYLNQWRWCAAKRGNDLFYAKKSNNQNKKRNTLLMHREILNSSPEMLTDHISGDGLDNRRKNLRNCNCSQNQMNRGKRINNKSGYKGVSRQKRDGKWVARIVVKNKYKYLGLFNTKEEAAFCYNNAAIKYHKEFARLNIIEEIK